jgi:diaminopimelate epimerase
MGYPIFEGAKIPTTLAPNFADGGVVEQAVTVNGRTYQASCVSMGNPHVIVFFDTMQALNEAFEKDAAALEHHEAFPANANIEFVHVTSPTHLTMRVFERGAGPTFACGTGACALTIAAVRAGRIPSAAKDVTVTLPGGDLQIRWAGPGEKVYMTGPAQKVFEGVIETDDWN